MRGGSRRPAPPLRSQFPASCHPPYTRQRPFPPLPIGERSPRWRPAHPRRHLSLGTPQEPYRPHGATHLSSPHELSQRHPRIVFVGLVLVVL